MKLIIMTLIVDICRLTVTVREGGLEAHAGFQEYVRRLLRLRFGFSASRFAFARVNTKGSGDIINV